MATANYGRIDALNPQFVTRLQALFSDAQAAGYGLKVGSTLRTRAEQQALYDEAMRKYGSNTVPGHQVAKPGNSRHESGLATDLEGTKQAKAWAAANASRYGIRFAVKGEDWHAEPVEIGGAKPPSGFAPIDVKAAKSAFTTGGTTVAKTPSRAERNNNPGNLMYNSLAAAKAKGAIALDTKGIPGGAGYAIFPTVDAGLTAALTLIKKDKYQKGTLLDAISTWAPPDDGTAANKGNNPKAYAAAVSKKSGIPVTAQMRSLSDDQLKQMLGAMFGVESGGAITSFNRAGTGSGEAARLGQGGYVSQPGAGAGEAARLGTGPASAAPMGQLGALTTFNPNGGPTQPYVPATTLPDLGMAQPSQELPMPGMDAQARTSALNLLMQMGASGATGRMRIMFDPRTGKTVTVPAGG